MKHILLIVLAFIIGCASQMPSPETQKQRLAVVDAQVSALANAVADLREQGLIGDTDFNNLVDNIKSASLAVDAAWAALDVEDFKSTQSQIQLANKILLEIHSQLSEVENE